MEVLTAEPFCNEHSLRAGFAEELEVGFELKGCQRTLEQT